MKRAALYVRVSTDRQTVENQISRLTEIATARGWHIVQIFSDVGSSGAKGRKDRPGLDEMLKQAQRHRFDVVMAWAIDRMGRSLVDLLGTIQHLEACGVDLFLDPQAIDTTTPAGKLMFQVTGAFAEFERSLIRQRIHAGLKRAIDNGRRLGRPLNNPEALDKARELLGKGLGINKVARQVGLSNTTIARLKAETSPPSGRDCLAVLPKRGSVRRGDREASQRDATALANGLKNGQLIALRDIDQVFNDLQIKKLADTLKRGALGNDPRFARSIRQDVRLFIEAKGLLNNAKLGEVISRLYRLTTRAEGDDRAADRLGHAVDTVPSDVWDWLALCNPEGCDIPTAAEITSTATRAGAVQRLRHMLSYGGLKTIGRKRPSGKHSQSFEPLLSAPKIEPNRPRGDAEREFVRNLGLTYLEARGKTPPHKVDFQSRGPFSQFVHECFELVNAPSGSVTRLINELGQARRAAASRKIEHREDAGAHLERDEWFRQGAV